MASGRTVGPSLAALLLGWMTLPPALFAGPGEHKPISDRGDAYVLVRGEGWSCTNTSLPALEALKERFSGPFLWARRAGKRYLIRDAGLIDEAQALFAPLSTLDPERSDFERRQSRLEADQEEVEREQEEIDETLDGLDEDSDARADEARRSRLERRKRELETKLRSLEGKQRELEAIERSIDQREEALEQTAERALWRLIDKAIAHGLAQPVD